MLASNVTCKVCDHVSHTEYPFISLSVQLNMMKKETVNELINKFTSVENLMDLIQCDACKQKQKSHKKLDIQTYPTILVVHFKRFHGMIKNNVPVIISKTIEFGDIQYELFAICNHSGSIRGGHYTAACMKRDKTWVMCNDNYVSDINILPTESAKPYLMFFHKMY